MAFTMIPIPPVHGPVTLTVGMFWGMVAFVLALILLVILWVVLVVRSQQRAQRQSQMKEAKRLYEASLQPQGGEQPQVPAPEEEKILLRR
jgi:uncharacterized membrane protein